jgi:diacylglycerol kinase family enzyme
VHEVANGLLRSGRVDVTLGLIPIGSANDYAFCLGQDGPPRRGWRPGAVRRVDVGLLRTGDGRRRYFINSLGLGFSSAVTAEARRIRRLQGLALYGLAFVRALWLRYGCAEMEITFDGRTRKAATFSLTVAVGRREGNLLLTPDAVPDDGWFDYLHAGALSRWEVLRHLPKIAWGGRLPTDHPALWTGRCREVHVRSDLPVRVHLDGELFVLPEEGVTTLHIQLLARALGVRTG